MTKEEFRQLCKTAWEKQQGFVIIDFSSKNTTAGTKVRMTSITYQIKLKIKIIIIFSLQKMENLLKQIVNNAEPKRLFSIVVSDIKTRFQI